MNTNQVVESSGKREKFVSLCEKRMNSAISNINLIGNLSNRSNYSYTEDDARKIFKALRASIHENEKRFSKTATRDGKSLFSLED